MPQELLNDTGSRVVNILGLNVNALSMKDVLKKAATHIESKSPFLLGVVNVAKVINCRKDKELRKSIDETDLLLADGLPLVWLSKLIGSPLPERVAGIDLMFRLLELSSQKKYSVYFLGAKHEVVKKVAQLSQEKYPGMRLAGYRDGYFDEGDEAEVAEEIRQSMADILFVAMSSPRKENFLRQWRLFMNVPVCHGVGGSFDVFAGVTKRAPLWMQKAGIEWFYRLIQEPGRLWKRYLISNSIFLVRSLKAIFYARFAPLFHISSNSLKFNKVTK